VAVQHDTYIYIDSVEEFEFKKLYEVNGAEEFEIIRTSKQERRNFGYA